jgi:hypothetical protein
MTPSSAAARAHFDGVKPPKAALLPVAPSAASAYIPVTFQSSPMT